jgi:drug/metabolite transporter (DMT)-like permease
LPALLLAGTLILQTWGLHYTTATKSGFITTLYVVFVPLLEALHLRRRISTGLWLCVLGAFVGTLLIVNVGLNEVEPTAAPIPEDAPR